MSGGGFPEDKQPGELFKARGQEAAQRLIGVEKLKILRERVRKCHREEGVNHFENCAEPVDAYLKALEAHKQQKNAL
ncbi:hypothetical protein PTSG_01286 [Salpingoeca rosetta]|uniref:NADH-ubiquinone oxidoreductase 12 kDa subunit n=1 Tax=Salpingoeca rosetta (strain ATCC 50818 / BSB-021) TaxID=946362 RepID=F2TZW8_SALR5|nr:uncharacterized protein PTSG_01286 [Salpingoeca rosetta]EGD80696.1 hypothetical protein PTSG_01286 [Salpingoeca rosetta]|eukprot:XP_004997257.1 hypothetical protein PTSG_01286 [Salpingoeca rosetta]